MVSKSPPKIDYPPITRRKWRPPFKPHVADPSHRKPITRIPLYPQHAKVPHSTLDKAWHKFRLVSKYCAVLFGPFAQNHARFLPRFRGKQGPAMCFSAIGCTRLKDVSQWDSDVIRLVLLVGTKLYHESTILNKGCTCTSPKEVHNTFIIDKSQVVLGVDNNTISGTLFKVDDDTLDLYDILHEFVSDKTSKHCILQLNDDFVAIWRQAGALFMFDPSDRDPETAVRCKEGKGVAVVMKFTSSSELVSTLWNTYSNKNVGIILTPMHILKISKVDVLPPDALPEVERKLREVKQKTCVTTKDAEKPPLTYLPSEIPPPLGTKVSPVKLKPGKKVTKPVVEEIKAPVSNTPSLSSLVDPNKVAEKKTLIPLEKPKPPSVTYFHSILPDQFGILRASYHQNDPSYSKFYGRQALANAIAALTMLRQHRSKFWFKKILDEILLTGETIFLDSRQNLVGDQELSVHNIAKTVKLNKNLYEPKIEEFTIFGRLQTDNFLVMDLLKAMEEFFIRSDAGILRGPILLAIWSEDGKYYMFDPNERDQLGQRIINLDQKGSTDTTPEPGYACLTWFASIKDLVALYMLNLDKHERRNHFILSKVEILDYVERPVDWFQFKVVRPGKWILRGTLSQNNYRFTVASRNTQCTAIATMSIMYAKVVNMSFWVRDTIDEIVIQGDAFYLRCVEILKTRNKYREKMLMLAEILTKYMVQEKELLLDIEECLVNGLVNAPDDYDFPNLRKGIIEFFKENEAGVVTAKGLSVAIWKDNDAYFYFDSHSRGDTGYADFGGSACVLRFLSVDDLARLIAGNLNASEQEIYNIGAVAIRVMDKMAETSAFTEFKFYKEITPTKAIIRGSTHEGKVEKYEEFTDKVAIPNMMAALAFALEFPSHMWDDHMVDKIMDLGLKLYLDSRCEYIRKDFENKAAWETEEKDFELVNIDNVLKEFPIGVSNITMEFGAPSEGTFEPDIDFDNEGNKIMTENVLKNFLHTHFLDENVPEDARCEGIIESDLLSCAIWRHNGYYYLFDSTGKDPAGNFYDKDLWSEKLDEEFFFDEDLFEDIVLELEEEFTGGDKGALMRTALRQSRAVKAAQVQEDESAPRRRTFRLSKSRTAPPPPEETVEEEEVDEEYEAMVKMFENIMKLYDADARACVLVFNSLDAMHDHIFENIPPNNRWESFLLYPMKVSSQPIVSKPTNPYDRSLGNWYQFVELDTGRWILRGTLNMHDKMYPESNKGRQFGQMCVIGCVFGRLYALPTFKPTTVDSILKYGDRMFTLVLREKEKALRDNAELALNDDEVKMILDETQIRTVDSVKRFNMGHYLVMVEVTPQVVEGDVTVMEKKAEEIVAPPPPPPEPKAGRGGRMPRRKEKEPEVVQPVIIDEAANVLSLRKGLNQFFESSNYGVLNAKDISVGLWKLFDVYYMFDPESRGPSGKKEVNGTACITRFAELDKLAEVFENNLRKGGSNLFTIDKLTIKSTEQQRLETDVAKVIPVKPKITPFETILPGKMILRGTFHQDIPKFNVKPGSASAANALVAIAMMHIHKAETWTRPIIDDVITNGYMLFKLSTERLGCSFNSWDDTLIVNLVCPDFNIGVMKVNCMYNLDGVKTGILAVKHPNLPNLYRACEELFFEFNQGIIESEPLTTAVWWDKDLYYMFDPNPRGSAGFRTTNGTACLMIFNSLKLMTEHFLSNVPHELQGEPFTITPIEVNVVETKFEKKPVMKKADILKVNALDSDDKSKSKTPKSPKKSKKSIKSPPCCCPQRDKVIPEKPIDFPVNKLTLDDKKQWVRQKNATKQQQEMLARERRLRQKICELEDGDAIVRAHYSQNSDKFNSLSRDKQTIPNALVAIVMAKLHDPNTWSYRNIEIVLDSGDALYQDSYRKYRPENPLLGIRNISRSFTLMHMAIKVAVYKPCVYGHASIDELYRALLNFFMQENAGILLCDLLTVAVFQKAGFYFMFDPHDRNSNGQRTSRPGVACLLRFKSLDNLMVKYVLNAGIDEDLTDGPIFSIMAVGLESVAKPEN